MRVSIYALIRSGKKLGLKKLYFVDPQTYLFQLNHDVLIREVKVEDETGYKNVEYVLKKSYDKLLDYYTDSENLKSILINEELTPSYFNDENTQNFVESTFRFQRDHFAGEERKIPLSKYSKALDEEDELEDKGPIRPTFLTTPYFYFTYTSSEWYGVNKKILEVARQLPTDLEKYVIICFNKELLLDQDEIDQVISDYTGFDGYITFISNLHEVYSKEGEIVAYKNFVKKLSDTYGKPIINLYGTFFSAMLNEFGVSGFSSGLCINESKNVDYVGFGRVNIRFYLSSLHAKLNSTEAKRYFKYFDPIQECSCDLCKLLHDNKRNIDTLFTNKEKRNKILAPGTMSHFLVNRKKELDFISNENIEGYIKKLNSDKETSNQYKDVVKDNQHLDKWMRVLKEEL